MKEAGLPIDEKMRIKDLHFYDILDSDNEENYDELRQLASA